MNNIKMIKEQQVLNKSFKVYQDKNGEYFFLAKDVANWIGHLQVSRMMELVDEDEKLICSISTSGQNRKMLFLSEDGLYEVLMQSRKPIAKQFKKEVKKILKQIRKTGGYIPLETNMTDAEIMAKALLISKRTIEMRDKQLEEQKPKVLFADAVSTSKATILVGELAKILKQNDINIGQNRLFKWLRINEYLVKRKGTDYNMPTQKSMNLGLFKIKETSITHSDGHITVSKTSKVTGKGQIYFINKFKGGKNEIPC